MRRRPRRAVRGCRRDRSTPGTARPRRGPVRRARRRCHPKHASRLPDARIEHLAAMHHVAPRTLQRLFRRYVGVGPKWVLKRVRIHEAADQLTAGSPPRWTELALDLGATTTRTSSATSGSSSDAHRPNTPPRRPGHGRTRTSLRGAKARRAPRRRPVAPRTAGCSHRSGSHAGFRMGAVMPEEGLEPPTRGL
jgi:AraC-like DNA-binding protein